MAPKEKLVKGQRAISSFFFKKPEDKPSSHQKHVLGIPAAPQPPNKRQKRDSSQHKAAVDDSQVNGTPSGLTDAQIEQPDEPEPIDLTEAPQEHSGHPSRGAKPGAAGRRKPAPYDKDAQHQRFQNKLVLGPASGLERDKTVVPQKTTPLEDQVYALKRKHPGILLLIEVGYKYRLFGEDADIASSHCNIFSYPDRNFMTASVPVHRLHVYVRRLVEAGYKVGIVRQTETAALKKAGDNRNAPFTRELAALYTRATLEAGDKEHVGEGASSAISEGASPSSWSNESLSSYLVCVVEGDTVSPQGAVDIGVVAIEISTGDVLHAQFRDGAMRTELESRLVFAAPSELLVASPVSSASQRLLGAYSSQTAGLRSQTAPREKYSAAGAQAVLTSFYTHAGLNKGALETVMGLPPLVLQALAFAVDFLKPFGMEAVLQMSNSFRPFNTRQEMALSTNTLTQLEILHNSDTGAEHGSLLWLLDHTMTVFGGRLLRSWVAHPLRDAALIQERLDAVQELADAKREGEGVASNVAEALHGLGDLERGITRSLHGTAAPAEFYNVMRRMASIAPKLGVSATEAMQPERGLSGISSPLLQRLLSAAAAHEVSEAAWDLLSVMDEQAALANQKIDLFTNQERFPGVFEARANLTAADAALVGLLPVLRRTLRLPRLEYTSIMNQGDFLIEVPSDRKDIPREWERVSTTKKMHRYRPPEVQRAMTELEMAKERLQLAAQQAWAGFMRAFAALYAPFRAAVQALAALDALQSLASLAESPGYVRPAFVGPEEEPQLVIHQGRHPVLDAALIGSQVVPNDTTLCGASGPRACIVTGPNMGGKSCYIRQCALIAIMAQIGSFVPAESVRMHVFDSVFTRMGASDNLAMGRSTFLEELSETSDILASATERSLVIIDELGRGTSTHDGLAIAQASLHHLVANTRCLTLFVTHYPKVASIQQEYPQHVACGMMSFIQQDPDTLEPMPGSQDTPGGEQFSQASVRALPSTRAGALVSSSSQQAAVSVPQIIFLYQLVEGVADKSFGLNVARMAHLPSSVIQRAGIQAAAMEEDTLQRMGTQRKDPAYMELQAECAQVMQTAQAIQRAADLDAVGAAALLRQAQMRLQLSVAEIPQFRRTS